MEIRERSQTLRQPRSFFTNDHLRVLSSDKRKTHQQNPVYNQPKKPPKMVKSSCSMSPVYTVRLVDGIWNVAIRIDNQCLRTDFQFFLIISDVSRGVFMQSKNKVFFSGIQLAISGSAHAISSEKFV